MIDLSAALSAPRTTENCRDDRYASALERYRRRFLDRVDGTFQLIAAEDQRAETEMWRKGLAFHVSTPTADA